MIFVAFNYRLGAFGWLAGPTLQSDGVENVGLYDQRQALLWIQDNIHLFGGDCFKITVMGKSAGGDSILLQMTAFAGNKGPVPFRQCIVQSAGVFPKSGTISGEATTEEFLSMLNVTSIDEARKLTSSALINTNFAQVLKSPYSTFTYGPTVDSLIAPALPNYLLGIGAFKPLAKVMVGYNSFEGGLFADPKVKDSASFEKWIDGLVPNLAPFAKAELTTQLYPAVFDGSLGYNDTFTRQATLFSENVFESNFVAILDAMPNASYAYQLAVTPGIHLEDLGYTFNSEGGQAYLPKVQRTLQNAIKSFVIDGVPKFDSLMAPVWSAGNQQVRLGDDSVELVKNSINRTRTTWWQRGLFN